MAEVAQKSKPGLAATLWSLLMMVCLLLIVAHLITVVRHDTTSEEDLIQSTFTTVSSKS